MKRPNCPKCGKPMTKSKFLHGKRQWQCRAGGGDRELCYTSNSPELGVRDHAGRSVAKPQIFDREMKAGTFIVTCAQNATPAHKLFLKSLKVAAKHLNAELAVIPIRYKNPTSRWERSQKGEQFWDAKLSKYLINVRKRLNPNLLLLADVKTQATATEPLTGFEGITQGESGILGHTKLQMKVIPAPSHKFPKILTTTGACTVPNYTDTKAGKIGEFHHTLGAVIVKTEGKTFHLRHVSANKTTGAFIDLDTKYTPRGVRKAPRPLALIMGDTHVDFIDPAVERGTFGERGLVHRLRPRHLIWHDLLDGYAVNPHHKGNPLIAFAKRKAGRDNVEAEVRRAVEFVDARTPRDALSIIVRSNHNDFLHRWLLTTDWRTGDINTEFFFETGLHIARSVRLAETGTEYKDPFAYWFERLTKCKRTRVLKVNESFALAGWELGLHGHEGPNGARGSLRNLRRIGVKVIIGHTHTPGINEGARQSGTSTRRSAEYTSGPSSWLQTHVVLHADSKTQLVTFIDGEYDT